jgi:hypothetical protein
MNEYSLASIATSRLDEARQHAEQRRRLESAGVSRPDLRMELAQILIKLGQWLGGPGLQTRQAWR